MDLLISTIMLISIFFAIICTAAITFLIVKALFQVAVQIFKYLISPEGFIILVGYLAAATLYVSYWFPAS
ncbi:hypothetical protein FD723_39760 (plasmid) [Nostoc sp. C052]|uniref:hypothetical protein n=1 Tax=Nostoc sp. C052 TaxID=2576902 RepID=UPI0015C32554|nr:hypothetical protein [Nostoc sp. C052]QLE46349.1 hypothetical protein FD723_39760 [Nostoc sp. C052]